MAWSAGALKGITIDTGGGGGGRTPLKSSSDAAAVLESRGMTSPGGALNTSLTATPSPMSRLQSGLAASMLEVRRLIVYRLLPSHGPRAGCGTELGVTLILENTRSQRKILFCASEIHSLF